MRTNVLPALVLALFGALLSGQNPRSSPSKPGAQAGEAEREIRAVLDTQTAAWNRGDLAQAETVLQGQPGVGAIYPVPANGNGDSEPPSELEIDFSGDDEAVATLLETLVTRKVRVASFTEMHTGLERARSPPPPTD